MPIEERAPSQDAPDAAPAPAPEGWARGLLRDPTFYIGLFFLVMIAGQAAFYAVAFQLPSDALPEEGPSSVGELSEESSDDASGEPSRRD